MLTPRSAVAGPQSEPFADPRDGQAAPQPARPRLALALAILAYVAVYGTACWLKYRYYLYDDFDLAIFTQALSELRHGSWFSSIRGMVWLGDHSSLILVPLLPLFAIAPSALTLLAVQTVALGLGAIPVFRLARAALGSSGVALAFAIAYLLQPALGYVNLFEFHPEALATPLLLAAFEAAYSGRRGRALAWASVALLAKEDVALVVAALGVWAVATTRPRPWRFASGCVALAVASLAITLLLLKPLAAGEVEYGAMYRQWGDSPAAAVRGAVTQPWRALSSLFVTAGNALDTRLKLELWLHLLLPAAFLSLASPGVLAIALPVLAAHLLSWRMQQHTIVFQYAALILPFVIASAVLGARRMTNAAPASDRAGLARRLSGLVLGSAALAQVMFGPFAPFRLLQTYQAIQRVWPTAMDRAMTPHRDRLLARIDRGGAVVASFEFLPRLATARQVHSLHHVLGGTYTFSSKPYPAPRHAEVIADLAQPRILPFLNPQGIQALAALARADTGRADAESAEAGPAKRWVYGRGDLIAYTSSTRGDDPWPVASDPEAQAPAGTITFDRSLTCLDARAALGAYRGEPTLALRTRWRLIAPVDAPCLVQWRVRDTTQAVRLAGTHVIGYGIDGPSARGMLEAFRDVTRVPVPARVGWQAGTMEIRVTGPTGRSLSTASDDSSVTGREGWFKIALSVAGTIDADSTTLRPPPRR